MLFAKRLFYLLMSVLIVSLAACSPPNQIPDTGDSPTPETEAPGTAIPTLTSTAPSTATLIPSPGATTQPSSIPTLPSGDATPAPQRIEFGTGESSAAVSGNLEASGSDLYALRALQGQTMTVELTFTEGRAILAVWGADGTVLMSDHAEASRFQGVLPSTQDYFILVKGRPDGETAYQMTVTIPPL